MYPFWDRVIWPVLQATGARRIVEIGALRGETTALMLERLGPDTELHVIDPVPEFDPAEHEREFPGRYIFHRDLSHNVLPTLPAVDVALVDGDHNWYTVYHELRMLSESARRDHAPLPVLVLHDVGWPYGRRDLYYVPERVPEEFRQPYEQKGIRPGTKQVLPTGGLNPLHYNAVLEGGPRNGVMTALDDFVAEYDRPLRVLVLPVYFGLAIVVEEARLARGTRARPRARRVREPGGQGRAPRDRGVDPPPGDPVPAQRLLRPARPRCTRRRPLPRSPRRRTARRAVPRPRAPRRVPRELHRARQGTRPHQARRPGARDAAQVGEARRGAARGRAAGQRSPGLDAPLHRHGPRAARPPAPVPRSGPRGIGSRRSRRHRHGTGRRRDLPRRLPRRARVRTRAGCGSPTASASPSGPTTPSSRGPTSTPCATALRASGYSTNERGSCRVRPRTRSPTRRSSRWR